LSADCGSVGSGYSVGKSANGDRSADCDVHGAYQFWFLFGQFAEVTDAGIKFGSVAYEIILLYLAGLMALAIGGPGRLSLTRSFDSLSAQSYSAKQRETLLPSSDGHMKNRFRLPVSHSL